MITSKGYFRIAEFLVIWWGLSGGFGAIAEGETSKEEAFAITIELTQSATKKRKVALFERYATAVERLQAEFQKNGQLDDLLSAKAEVKAARESMTTGDEDFPGIAELRKVLAEELDQIDAAETEQLNEIRRKYIAVLRQQIPELTKAGRVEEATRLDNQRKALEAKLAGEDSGQTPSPARGEPSGKLIEGEVLYGEVTLSGGEYRLQEELQIGYRKEKTEDEQGFLSVRDRAELSGGGIWVNFGSLVAEDARFEDMALKEELQGTFTATRCLFENCTFEKKGGWMVNWFGTRWVFEECVFHRAFFTEWTNAKVGVKITNCTFIGVDFPSFLMKENPEWESEHEWRTIENCRFTECEVPISVLLATEDCVFEDCRFVEDKLPETKQLLTEANKPMNTTVYFIGIQEPEIPSPSSRLKFHPKRATTAMEKWGCPPFYELQAGEVRFREGE